jgi:DtxR family Mn-dependent transcriptional regulator
MPSQTIENYLKAIYLITEQSDQKPVSTNELATQMQTQAASVTDMLKRLSHKKLVHYKKYQGALLTLAGKAEAVNIIRKHRLWEYFLVEKLKFNWDQVHEVAEQLEHVDSDLLIEKLDHFLDHPKVDPHGDPIPAPNGQIVAIKFKKLCELKIKEQGKVSAVIEQQPSFLQHLDRLQIHVGTNLRVLDKVSYDGSMEIAVNRGATTSISYDIAKNILVAK